MSLDSSILGMVFALILFIIFFSAIVLYLAFRIKETFRAEKRRGVLVTKIVFLIGILFLAGGSFYFFANILTSSTSNPSNENGPNENGLPQLSLTITYPSTVRINSQMTISFTLTNPTDYTAHDVLIQTSSLLDHFTLTSATHDVIGNTISIGDVASGTMISSLELISKDRPSTIKDTVTVTYLEMNQPITQEITITTMGGGPP